MATPIEGILCVAQQWLTTWLAVDPTRPGMASAGLAGQVRRGAVRRGSLQQCPAPERRNQELGGDIPRADPSVSLTPFASGCPQTESPLAIDTLAQPPSVTVSHAWSQDNRD